MEKDCKECGLPITPYKQSQQVDPDMCEACAIVEEAEDMDLHYRMISAGSRESRMVRGRQ